MRGVLIIQHITAEFSTDVFVVLSALNNQLTASYSQMLVCESERFAQ